MQANPLLTATDKTAAATKTSKNNSSGNAENSFNQMLNKEISGSKRPEMEAPRPANANSANKPTQTNKNNNNATNNNASNNVNNNGNANNQANAGNKLAKNDDNVPDNPGAAKTDAASTDGTVSKEDETDVKKEDELSISEQILALVGNLNPAPVAADIAKKPVASDVDTSKNDSLAAVASTDAAVTASDLIDSNTVANLTKSGTENQDFAAPQLDGKSTGKEQIKPEDPASKADVAAIAAQMIASKADGKTTTRLAENGQTALVSPLDKEAGKLTDAISRAAELTSPAPKDALTSKGATTVSANTPSETAVSDAKISDLSLAKATNDKTGEARTVASAADTPKSFATDIAQAKDAMAERISEVKTGATAKDAQQVMAPPVIAANAVSSTQFNAAVLAAEQIAPRVGSNGWDKAVGQKVVWMVGEGLQSAELTLNPPDLGPLQVVLKVSNEQASASFSSAQPEVREALEAALPRLKQMLSDAGVQLTGFSVNSQAAGQGQNFAQQQPRSLGSARTGVDLPDNTISTTSTAPARIQTNNGLVDTFA
ncbi:flagellar hook-length control protein FliK [Undibacterium sp. Tian12W]|uniref:flagellar hook-length control protein FliK n=1 Tax=Undibacterium sp. Tian12W TaxID=3413054 RepID=UPI003BEFE98D